MCECVVALFRINMYAPARQSNIWDNSVLLFVNCESLYLCLCTLKVITFAWALF